MRSFRPLVIAIFVTTALIGAMAITGMVVRHINHPIFTNVKDPIIFIVDIPKELIREFIIGAETRKRKLPEILLQKSSTNPSPGKDFYYYQNGRLHSSEHNRVVNEFSGIDGIFYISHNRRYFYTKVGDFLTRFEFDQKSSSLEKTWQRNFPFIHHLIHVDGEGYIYAPTYFPLNKDEVKEANPTIRKLSSILAVSGAPPYDKTNDVYRDDGIIVISPAGEVLLNKSLTEIFYENDLEHLIYTHGLEVDPFHLNSVFPASTSKGFVKKGDLILSLRHMSMLLIYRPTTNKIVWLQSGPWLNQHSAKFDENGNIYVFDNNLIETHYQRRRESGFIDGGNRLLKFDVLTSKTEEIEICGVDDSIKTATGVRSNSFTTC